MKPLRLAPWLGCAFACLPLLVPAATTTFPADAGLVDITAAPYHADKTGAQDVTWKIQRAIADHLGTTALIYFPTGTYKVSRTLDWMRKRDLTFDAGSAHTVAGVQLAFNLGGQRLYYFEVQVSSNNTSFTTVGEFTSAQNTALQTFAFPATSARYVRIRGYGNSEPFSSAGGNGGQFGLSEARVLNASSVPLAGTFAATLTSGGTLANLGDNNLTTTWVTNGENFHRLAFQGQDRAATTIRLIDNAPLFQNTTTARAVIQTRNMPPDFNDGFLNSIYNLTVNTGSGNPGATGIAWMECNVGTIRDVTVVSQDKQGMTGLYCDGWPGPGYVKDVLVDGFNLGISMRGNLHSITFEDITVQNQNTYGFSNGGNGAFIHNFTSTNNCPAIYAGTRQTLVVNGTFNVPGTGVVTAPGAVVVAGGGSFFGRNLTRAAAIPAAIVRQNTSSYTTLAAGPAVAHYATNSWRLFDVPQTTLGLTPEEAPEFHDNTLGNWANVKNYGAIGDGVTDDATAIQNALNAAGKTTVYFPPGTYRVGSTLTIAGGIRRVVGTQGVILSPTGTSIPAGAPLIRFGAIGGANAIVERLHIQNAPLAVEHASTKTLVIRDATITRYANSGAGTGKLHVENVMGFFDMKGQAAFMRQINPEGGVTKLRNDGGALWVLGMKTEFTSTAIETLNGGRSELLGGFIFCNSGSYVTPLFVVNESQFSATFTQYVWNTSDYYNLLVRETRGGVTKDLYRWDPTGNVALYSSVNTGVVANHLPSVTLSGVVDNQVFTEPAGFSLSAAAGDTDGTIASTAILRLDAFPTNAGPASLGATSASVSGLAAGVYTFYAKTTDNLGATAYSTPVRVIVKPAATATGKITREYWDGILRPVTSAIETDPRYPNDPLLWDHPAALSSTGLERNYGLRLRGYITPPVDGNYTFWVSGAPQALFRLSTDATVANKELLGWTPVGTGTNAYDVDSWQMSAPIPLLAGQKYYFEALNAHTGDGGHVEIAWQGGPIATRAAIAPAYLSPYDNTVDDPVPAPSATERVLLPTDDTYTRGGGTVNTNYQGAVELKVGEGGARAFFKFDLSSLAGGTVTSAQLELVPVRVFAPGATHTVDYVPDDSWVEASVNHNHQPAPNPSVFAINFTAPAPGGLATINLTSLVQNELATDPAKRLSLRVWCPITAEVRYSSKEGIAEFMPVLRVTGSFPPSATGPETIVDNAQPGAVQISGGWATVWSTPGYHGANFLHDANGGKGGKTVRFTPDLPYTGYYQVYARWPINPGFANNVPHTITHANGASTVTVNQGANGGAWFLLGSYLFNQGTAGNVLISNAGTTSTVVADAVRFVKQ